jgi:hypothetical protein
MILAVAFAGARAQRLEDGEIEFDQKFRKTKEIRKDLFNGSIQPDPKNKDHLEAIDMQAKAVTYPLVWRTQSARPKDGDVGRIVDFLEADLNTLNKFRANTQALQSLYVKQVIERAVEAAQKGKPIASLNAARLLSRIPARRVDRGFRVGEKEWAEEVMPRLAEGGGEQLALGCLTLLEDPKCNDGNRYYLFQTLADLLSMPRQPNPLVKPETLEKVCAAAAKFVQKPVHFPRATPRGDVEGYKMMRLQAVKALGRAGAPAVGKERPALVLARVAADDERIVPAPRIEERVEAVIGLGRMGPGAAKVNDYQADYAAAQICRGVADFGTTASGNLDSKPVVKLRPWKVDAGRMIEALNTLKESVKVPYVQEAVKQCVAVLAPVEAGRVTDANVLNDWLGNNPPQARSLFRGEDSVIKPRAAKEK